ncbi:MAG TPA: amino acid ABC transporter permease [Ktedonobacteraceae bacterium]|nr:amino acid ABC transporter permease [Ktedonobacteraceae bacterium]
MFHWDVVWQNLFSTLFLAAAWTTLWMAVVAQTAGVIIGLVLALMRISRFPVFSWLARFYIWLFRGSPLLVQILILYFGLPEIFPALTPYITVYSAALIAFSFNEGAYMAEIIRAGITSVDPGQMEAAKSLGMRYALAMRRIILPQAARVIIPPLGNEFNNMLKTTSLASVIGLFELTYTAEVNGSQSFVYFELLIVATFYYLVMTTLWGYVQGWIENRIDPNRTTKYELADKKSFTQRVIGFGSRERGGTLVSGR